MIYRKKEKNIKKNNVYVVLIVTVLVSLICGSLSAYTVLQNITNSNNEDNTNQTSTSIKLTETNSIAESVSKVYDSVVVVEGFSKGQMISTGTGFIYKQDQTKSYIMTNHHVVSDCDEVKIILSDSTEIDATVKGSEAYSDIAVLEVESDKVLQVATIGKSDNLKVGDTLFAVGSPEGADYAGTVTKGILSGKDRLVAVALTNSTTSDYYMKVLQTDAAINPGNSGGPICNINGEVIGITNMKLVDATVEGMGFAIPIEDALYYAAILEKGEDIERPYFGISMLDIADSYYLWQNEITIPEKVTEGVVVIEASKDSPADKAGLKKGDIIIKLADENISSLAEFRYELYKHKVGEKVSVTYIRDNKEKETEVTLEKNND